MSLLRVRDKYESRLRHRESLTKEASSPKAGDDPPFPKPSRSLPLPHPSSLPIDETETAELPLSAGESRGGTTDGAGAYPPVAGLAITFSGRRGGGDINYSPARYRSFLTGSAVNLLSLARKWTGEGNAQKCSPEAPNISPPGFSMGWPMTQFSLDLCSFRRLLLSPSTTHLDAQFRVLRRAVGRVLTLARERRVVVVLARHHPQHRFHGVQGAVVEQFLGRFYAPVQHVPQPVDPRDLQLMRRLM